MNVKRNLQMRADFFKALGNPTRLLIINLIRLQARHTDELASILELSASTVSHHLSILTKAGLLHSHKEQYYQVYQLVDGMIDGSLLDMVTMPQPKLDQTVVQDAFSQKVLKNFFYRGRLSKIPSQQKKLLVVLAEIAKHFEPGQFYDERAVNRILIEMHDDVATLRRELVNFKFLSRDKRASRYERTVPGGDA